MLHVSAKPRYRAVEAPASVSINPDHTITVLFDEPQRALTLGQIVVLYQGDTVVAGGTISHT